MKAIHLVRLDKVRPALLLTREHMLPCLHNVTVAPITGTVTGAPTEVPVGIDEGLDHDSVISFDNVQTVAREHVLGVLGYVGTAQEPALIQALLAAYDLRVPPRRTGPPVPRT